MKKATYRLADGTTQVVEYDPNHPCNICGKPVIEASTGGTVICPWCDSGVDRPEMTKEEFDIMMKTDASQIFVDEADDWRPEIGARVLLTEKHPYYKNRTGTVARREKWMGVPAIAVKLDTGETPGVTSPEQIKELNNAQNT